MADKRSPAERISSGEIEKQYEYMRRVRDITAKKSQQRSAPLYACVKTYGCQQNEADSERLAGMAVEMGYALTDDDKCADLILINTCAVREHAELKALSITGQFKHLKEKNKELVIGICGCMVSQEHRCDDIKHRYPYVDFLFGTSMLYRLPEILCKRLSGGKRGFYSDYGAGNIAEGLPVSRKAPYKAWVSVMYGCNNFCTYCIVPYVRGRERSRLKEDILAEVRELVQNGCHEITLLGQNVNSYGLDIEEYKGNYDFASLLCDINAIEGDFIIRFMTSHPKDASKRLIDTLASLSKAAPHFHLPLQSGSDRVLKRMNRRYTSADYLKLLAYMREKMPDICVTSDIITGFPGETEEDFEETLRVIKEANYDMIYSFIYSKRKGTPAAEYDDQIPADVTSARFRRLLDTQNEIAKEKNSLLVGKVFRVLCDGVSKSDENMYTGRTPGAKLVHFPSDVDMTGKFVNIKITSAETFALFGEKF